MDADKPYGTPFATSMACSRLPMGITETTGPKISSCATRMFGEQSPNTVGSWNQPFACAPPSSRFPPASSLAPSFFPISTYDITVFNCDSLMHGPISVEASSPLPTLSDFTRSTNRSTKSLYKLLWTATRLAAVQRCPLVPKPPQTAPSTAKSRLASSITMMMFFPPISRLQCLNSGAQVCEMTRPTSVEPVKLTTGTSRFPAMVAPTRDPLPLTKFSTPRGTPASVSTCTRLYTDSGVSWAGLITTVFPLISAGMIFHDGIAIGKFHVVISPHTPMDCRTLIANLFGSSEGVVCPNSRRPPPAM